MGKYTFEDVYIKKKYGEVVECDYCNGSGIVQHTENCQNCEGRGFNIKESKETQ